MNFLLILLIIVFIFLFFRKKRESFDGKCIKSFTPKITFSEFVNTDSELNVDKTYNSPNVIFNFYKLVTSDISNNNKLIKEKLYNRAVTDISDNQPTELLDEFLKDPTDPTFQYFDKKNCKLSYLSSSLSGGRGRRRRKRRRRRRRIL